MWQLSQLQLSQFQWMVQELNHYILLSTKVVEMFHQINFQSKYSEISQGYSKSLIVDGQPLSNVRTNLTSIFPQTNNQTNDRRIRINETLQYPFSAIGLIMIKFSNSSNSHSFGTGFLVGANMVLTAAFNCYDSYEKQQSKEMSFCPALNRINGQRIKVKRIYYPEQYKNSQYDDLAFDFAILELEQSIGNKYGTLGLDFSNQQSLQQAFIIGYPGQVESNDTWRSKIQVRGQMYGTKGSWQRYQEQIRYTMRTSAGQGGSPILIQKNGKFYVIGIHLQNHGQYRCGISLNDRVRVIMNQWLGNISEKLTLDDMELRDHDMETLAKQDFPKLIHLHLQNNEITHIGVQLICQKFTRLQSINLSTNKIKTFPTTIAQLKELKELKMSGNKLTKLSPSIQLLVKLESLSLEHNDLVQLPDEIGRLGNLKELNVSGNKLKQLPESIGQLQKLQILKVYHNKLTQLPQKIVKLKGLKQFKHYDNPFSNFLSKHAK